MKKVLLYIFSILFFWIFTGCKINSPSFSIKNFLPISTFQSTTTGVVQINKSTVNLTENGSSSTYTIVLSKQPTSVVSVQITIPDRLKINQTTGTLNIEFSQNDWNVPQTLTLEVPDDDLLQGTETVSVTHTSSSTDSSFNNLSIDSLSVTIADDDLPSISIVESGGNTIVGENGSTDNYTVVLTRQPDTDVTIQFDVGSSLNPITSLTFTNANWNVAQTVTVSAIDNALVDGNRTATISHTSTSTSTLFNGLTASLSLTIQDDDTASVLITESGGSTNVTEGGATDTYTVVLSHAPTADVTINFTTDSQIQSISSITFLTSNWSTAQTITVTATNDSIAEGSHSSTIAHSATSTDSNYNGITIPQTTVSITDNDTASVSISKSTASVSESGTTDSYTIVLTSQPLSNVTISFTTDSQLQSISSIVFNTTDWLNPKTVTISASDDSSIEAAPQTSTISHSSSSTDTNYNSLTITNMVVTITDNDTAGVNFSKTTTNVSESGTTDSYTLSLTSQPTADVVVSFNTGTQVTAIGNKTFTTSNWNTPQTVSVSAVNDSVAEGAHTGTIAHSLTSGDTNYNGLSVSDVSVNITDNDTEGITRTETGGSTDVVEGNSTGDSISFVLTSEPTADVTISMSFNSSQIHVNQSSSSPASIVFTSTDWSTSKSVKVVALCDAASDAGVENISFSVSSTDPKYSALTLSNVNVNITDNPDCLKLNGTIQSGTVSMSGGSNQTISITTVNPEKAFTYCNFKYSGSGLNNLVTCQLNSAGTQVEIKSNTAASNTVNWYVVEFATNAGVIAQRGLKSFGSADSSLDHTLTTPIDPGRSFVLGYVRTTSTSNTNDEQRLVMLEIVDSTTIRFSRGETGIALDVEWQVIQLDSASVQKGTSTISAGSTTTTASITALDLSKSFLIFNHKAGNVAGCEADFMTRGRFSANNQLTFNRSGTGDSITISWFAIEISRGATVQNGSEAIANNVITNVAVTSLTTNKNMIVMSNSISVGNGCAITLDSGTFSAAFSSSTNIEFERFITESNTGNIDWFTVEFQ
ncbi:MAG: hypothetical protein KDK54_18585 [Leptospiraceae bacterium]|nr:hypothetical protein [Leptospiraceae bacterium]